MYNYKISVSFNFLVLNFNSKINIFLRNEKIEIFKKWKMYEFQDY